MGLDLGVDTPGPGPQRPALTGLQSVARWTHLNLWRARKPMSAMAISNEVTIA